MRVLESRLLQWQPGNERDSFSPPNPPGKKTMAICMLFWDKKDHKFGGYASPPYLCRP